jgi:hypothetical protein
MGCQHICQNPEIDNKFIIADTGSKNGNRKYNNSRNTNFKGLKNEFSSMNDSKFKCSMNIKETLITKDILKIKIKASNIHKMIPIWLEENNEVFFKVSGEWGFNEHPEFFDSLGCFNFEEKPNNMNFGSLVGYIPGDEYFNIFDELSYVPKKSGPLFMFQNNGLYSVNPKGELEIEIKGGTPLSIYDIEFKLGWDMTILDTSIPEMKEDEKILLILINKVRTNPKLFASQYLSLSRSEEEHEFQQVLNIMKPLHPLKTTSKLYNISKNHAIDLGINNIAGHTSSNGLNMEQRLQYGGILTKVFAENCIFGYNDPLEIIMRLLIDEDNENRNQRKIILSPDFNSVGISIEPHSGDFCWSCIQDFILDS